MEQPTPMIPTKSLLQTFLDTAARLYVFALTLRNDEIAQDMLGLISYVPAEVKNATTRKAALEAIYMGWTELYPRARTLKLWDEQLFQCHYFLELSNQIKDPSHRGVMRAYEHFGIVYMEKKDWPQALEYLKKAVAASSTLPPLPVVVKAKAHDLFRVTELAYTLKLWTTVVDYGSRALKGFDALENYVPPPNLTTEEKDVLAIKRSAGNSENDPSFFVGLAFAHLNQFDLAIQTLRRVKLGDALARYNMWHRLLGVVYPSVKTDVHKVVAECFAQLIKAIHDGPPDTKDQTRTELYGLYSRLVESLNQLRRSEEALVYAKEYLVNVLKDKDASFDSIYTAWDCLSSTHCALQNYQLALECGRKMILIIEQGRKKRLNSLARAHARCGTAHFKMRQWIEAIKHFDVALDKFDQVVENEYLYVISSERTSCLAQLRLKDEAIASLNKLREDCATRDTQRAEHCLADSLISVVDMFLALKDYVNAIPAIEEAVEVAVHLGNIYQIPSVLNFQAQCYRELDQPTEALESANRALQVCLVEKPSALLNLEVYNSYMEQCAAFRALNLFTDELSALEKCLEFIKKNAMPENVEDVTCRIRESKKRISELTKKK